MREIKTHKIDEQTTQDTMPALVAQLRELMGKATPGEWEAIAPRPPELWDARIFAGTRFIGMIGNSDNADGCDGPNAALIAATHNALPRLLTRLERLESVAEAVKGYVPFLPISSAKEGGAVRFSANVAASDTVKDALDNLNALEAKKTEKWRPRKRRSGKCECCSQKQCASCRRDGAYALPRMNLADNWHTPAGLEV